MHVAFVHDEINAEYSETCRRTTLHDVTWRSRMFFVTLNTQPNAIIQRSINHAVLLLRDDRPYKSLKTLNQCHIRLITPKELNRFTQQLRMRKAHDRTIQFHLAFRSAPRGRIRKLSELELRKITT